MEGYHFLDEVGTFTLENPENYSDIYFPIAEDGGLKSSVTPNLGGDSKMDQNSFLLEPVSIENLRNTKSSRNFWCQVNGKGSWSATGVSAEENSKKFTQEQDESSLKAGLMWHTVTRSSKKYGLKSEITLFIPKRIETGGTKIAELSTEVMLVKITNIGEKNVTFTPVAAIPIYGRSADNIRDHRHVTSLLHQIFVTEAGVEVTPTLSFDERGHQKNNRTYFVKGFTQDGQKPESFYPTVDEFVGEGGTLEHPKAVLFHQKGVPQKTTMAGKEAMGGMRFAEITLAPQESSSYTVLCGTALCTSDAEAKRADSGLDDLLKCFSYTKKVTEALCDVQSYWKEKINVSYCTGDTDFNRFMHWVSFQPILRRIYGCSFLPHHDYGKGGRGWRDLWQDCLALLLINPSSVREQLLSHFGGVRMDGTNATIIGNGQGEFIADRNRITRVWMDHGVWPFLTTKLYIDQTGDIGILETEAVYFKDKQIARGTQTDLKWKVSDGSLQKCEDETVYRGTVLEHLLLENLTSFYEVGEHNHMLLRGADWNDALDMAAERGESVAFTNAYAGNLAELADLTEALAKEKQLHSISVAKEMAILFTDSLTLYESVSEKKRVLEAYVMSCRHHISGEKTEIPVDMLLLSLREKSKWLMQHIRKMEWVRDSKGNGWFNGYYDNSGKQVEGEFQHKIRMMLTGQVFAIMSGTARKEEIEAIVKSADCYLYQEAIGGYRLNTNFDEIKTDLGRMFGFAYGDKENGAVFSHMAVMYANALYKRGYAAEGYRALNALQKQSLNFPVSRIYPGIPEYFNSEGRGQYHYLTGAASWYMLTVITQMYGIRGELGNLVAEPKLVAEQFDEHGRAEITLVFAGIQLEIIYQNEQKKEYAHYFVKAAKLDETVLFVSGKERGLQIEKETLKQLNAQMIHTLHIVLG